MQREILGANGCNGINRYEGLEQVHTDTKGKNGCRQAQRVRAWYSY